jgi:hypothetical protein
MCESSRDGAAARSTCAAGCQGWTGAVRRSGACLVQAARGFRPPTSRSGRAWPHDIAPAVVYRRNPHAPFGLYGMPISYIVDRSKRIVGYLPSEADWTSPKRLDNGRVIVLWLVDPGRNRPHAQRLLNWQRTRRNRLRPRRAGNLFCRIDLVPVGRLPSQFGQSSITVWPRYCRALPAGKTLRRGVLWPSES